MNELFEISQDLFSIASRIKEIDSAYTIFYNKKLCRYEVHNEKQRGNTLCFVVPFDDLDARTLEMVYATRVQNAEKLLQEIEQHNEKIEKDLLLKHTEKALAHFQRRNEQ